MYTYFIVTFTRLSLCFFSFFVFFFFASKAYSAGTRNLIDGGCWNVSENSGRIIFDGSSLVVSDNNLPINHFPFLTLKEDCFPATGPFEVFLRFKFTSSGDFGTVFALSQHYPTDPMGHNGKNDTLINFYQDGSYGSDIGSSLCRFDTPDCQGGHLISHSESSISKEYIYKIVFDNTGTYYLYSIEPSSAPYLVFKTPQNQPRSIGFWIGRPIITSNLGYWNNFEFYDLTVKSLPTNLIKDKAIIIPGFGASWDLSAILSGQSGNGWAIPSQITVYNNLIKSIENNGYEKDKDLYVFAYDWRKPLDTIADDLKSFLDSKIASGEKVKIVGHSMGGLVARSYIQKYGSEKVDRLVMAGSPNKGALQAYGLWQGTTAWTSDWWSQSMVELLMESNRLLGETKTDTLRRMSPSVKDLMPTFNFLISNGSEKDWQILSSKNSYLNQLNQQQNSIDSLLGILTGKGVQTNEKVKVESRTWLDRLWKRWEDGRPIENPFVTTDGDGTVTIHSAGGIFTNKFELVANHGEIVGNTGALEKIMDELGLDKTKIDTSTQNTESGDGVFMAFLKSPGKLQVCKNDICNESLGIYVPSQKLFILPRYFGDKLSVKVIEDGQGQYSLHMGKADKNDSSWDVVQGNLNKSGQTDSYVFENGQVDLGSRDTAENNLREAYRNIGKLKLEWLKTDLIEKIIKSKNNQRTLDIAQEIRAKILWQMQISHWHKQDNDLPKLANLLISLDRYMSYQLGGVFGKNHEYRKVLAITQEYRKYVEKQIKSTKSLNSGEYYERAVDLIEETKSLENRKLFVEDKLQSARSWLTAAWLLR